MSGQPGFRDIGARYALLSKAGDPGKRLDEANRAKTGRQTRIIGTTRSDQKITRYTQYQGQYISTSEIKGFFEVANPAQPIS